MYKQYRNLEPGEFIIVSGDCSQGGGDYNACQFLSKSKLDVPLVYHARGVAATMTSDVIPVLERIFDTTGVKPIVCFERNNGGASEMERLSVLNRLGKYQIYKMREIGVQNPQHTDKLGYTTNTATRPMMLGDLKNAIDNHLLNIYDPTTINEMFAFIINDQGKPEAEVGAHDDLIMSLAIAWQLYQTENKPLTEHTVRRIINELPVEPWKKRTFY